MKQTIIQSFDDLDWHERQQKTPADDTVTVGLNGRWYELDLTAAHVQELAKTLDRYLGAGNEPSQLPRPKAKHGGRRKPDLDTVAYNRGLRAWVDEHEMKNEAGMPAYTTPGGGFYPPKQLKEKYDAYLRSQNQVPDADRG